MTVRVATEADALAAAEVQVAAWRQAYTAILPADYLASLDLKRIAQSKASLIQSGSVDYLVAELEGQIAGYAVFGANRFPEFPGDFELQALYVRPEVQSRGIGRAMMHEGVRRQLAAGKRSMIVWAFSDNHPARAFYSGLGGRHLGSSSYEIAGSAFPDEAYGFDDLARLLDRLVPIQIRRHAPDDDLEALTAMIHRAYALNASMGLLFTAYRQTPAGTRDRLNGGTGFVIEREGALVGCAIVETPHEPQYGTYSCPGVLAALSMFAVEPALQGIGLGHRLFRHCEQFAREQGADFLALDTAKPAHHLVAYYQRQGSEIVGEIDYRPGTNYESWIMAKPL